MSELPEQLFRHPLSREFEFLGLFIWSFPSDYITITNIVLPSTKTSRDEWLLLGAWSVAVLRVMARKWRLSSGMPSLDSSSSLIVICFQNAELAISCDFS